MTTRTAEHTLEDILLEKGLVTTAQIQRAHRIRGRLQKPRPLGEVLIELGQIARSDYERVQREYRSSLGLASILRDTGALSDEGCAAYEAMKLGAPSGTDREILVDGGLVTEELFLRALSAKYDIPYVEPDISLVDSTLLSKVSIPYLVRYRALPCRIADGHLTVVMADPLDAGVLGELERIYCVPARPCCGVSQRIVEALQTLDKLRDEIDDGATSLQYSEIKDPTEDDEDGEGAVRIVDYLLSQAIVQRASDLHVEPLKNKVQVRVRVDGSLKQLTDLPKEFAGRMASRIKILAGMDIAEHRLHQDGRFFVKFNGREIDLRVSSYASMFGETLVLRLLDRELGLLPMETLGFEPRILSMLKDLVLPSSSGLTLVTGPTGSGKTTTMYSLIDYINDPSLKVISCENPVEYILEGTAQCSVNEKSGPTFADSLRAIVRQDPDIIVVGEIRDKPTAGLAVESALVGHKVFSTFHTEDAVGAVIRLMEMGIEPFLVSSTLSCVIAQRLVRRICGSCRRPGEHSNRELRFLGLHSEDLRGLPLLEGAGCEDCSGTGFKGRIGIHEVLLLDDDFRDAVLRQAPSKDLRSIARSLPGFLTLQEDGLLKVVAGMTTLSELVGNVPRDPGARPLAAIREVAAMRRALWPT